MRADRTSISFLPSYNVVVRNYIFFRHLPFRKANTRGRNNLGRPSKQTCSLHSDNRVKPEKENERWRQRKKEREKETRNYASLLMKQSPLRPCYLDVRSHAPRVSQDGFNHRDDGQDFPRVHSGASGIWHRNHRQIKADEKYFGHET